MSLVVGQLLQTRYRIVALLGQGGMGAVYLAEDTVLGDRRCAIKENVPDPGADPQTRAQLRQQFIAEASILAKLNHPSLPAVHDYFAEVGNEYLVMEYIEGEDLQTVLDRHMQSQGGPLPEKPVLLWIDQVLDALTYLHGQQPQAIIHRDVKPSNIILTHQGKVKLVDFGLVKLLDRFSPKTVQAVKGLGTPPYTPLEQYSSGYGHTDARSDIYSLGVTLYVLLTGAIPPDAPQIAGNPASLTPPRQIQPFLSPGIDAAVLKAMAVQPSQRFQTTGDMRQALAHAFTGGGGASPVAIVVPQMTVLGSAAVTAPPQPRRKPTSGWSWTVVVALVLLAALGLSGRPLLSTVTRPTPPPDEPAGIAIGATPTPSPRLIVRPSILVTPLSADEPAPTQTPTDSPTLAPTSTPVPSPTPEPASTAVPPTATPTLRPQVDALVSGQSLNLRAGPGIGYTVLDTYGQGTAVEVQGKSAADDWLQVRTSDGKVGWMVTARLQVNVPLDLVAVVAAPSLPTPTPAQAAPTSVALMVQPSPSSPLAAEPDGTWVLVADSAADFPGPLPDHKWWYLWSVGRFNFEWQEMTYNGSCYHSPNDWKLQICRDRVFLDDRGDLSLQYKAPRGGTYRFDWQAGDTIEFYKHADRVASGTSGSQVIDGVIDWELFFFVPRGRARDYSLSAQVYRLEK